MKRLLIAVAALAVLGAGFSSCGRAPATRKRLIVLGMDGLDPHLLRRFMDAGKLPNFSALAARGGVVPLTTSNPPQSPVAWSNLITGLNPGGHGIFDFIHRDPATLTPYLSTSKVEPPSRTLTLGDWVLPLSGGRVTLLRKGRAFWEILDEHRIPATIYRMPANFPPVETRARSLAGMGTPDLLGTYGTFSFFTDDPLQQTGALNGGRAYLVQREGSRIAARLEGPYNTLRKGQPAAGVEFTAYLDPLEPVAKIVIQGREILLQEGEWSDWVRVEFPLAPLVRVSGICKFYLQQAQPRFGLYVTPINLDPRNPALPLSTPASYAADLAEELGPYFTQGIAEDTKALSTGVLSDAEYLQQARMVLDEQMRAYAAELARFRAGLFFFYFSSIDLNSHMFWRALDPFHPAHTPEAAIHSGLIEELYVEMDRAVGQALARLDADTTLLVLSDHGFAPYFRSFNLNTWLLQNGYLALQPGVDSGAAGEYLANVDWSRTRAYGIGLNSLYVNLRGRERAGIVAPGAEAGALVNELRGKLLALRDPELDFEEQCKKRRDCYLIPVAPVFGRVDRARDAFSGGEVAHAPDLVLGYNRGYRAGWSTVLGGFSARALEDNLEAWSGDHCMDFTQVPGVLLSSRKLAVSAPALTDVAPTILAEFGVAPPKEMTGRPVW